LLDPETQPVFGNPTLAPTRNESVEPTLEVFFRWAWGARARAGAAAARSLRLGVGVGVARWGKGRRQGALIGLRLVGARGSESEQKKCGESKMRGGGVKGKGRSEGGKEGRVCGVSQSVKREVV
jgi:hypothetical protein